MLTSDKFYRSFVLLPCEICVVPYRHGKIAADWNDIPLATSNTSLRSSRRRLDSIIVESIPPKILPEILYTSTSFKSCRCQLYCIIVESILNRQADYISSSIRLAANAPMRRKAPLGTVAGQPGLRPVR